MVKKREWMLRDRHGNVWPPGFVSQIFPDTTEARKRKARDSASEAVFSFKKRHGQRSGAHIIWEYLGQVPRQSQRRGIGLSTAAKLIGCADGQARVQMRPALQAGVLELVDSPSRPTKVRRGKVAPKFYDGGEQ